MSKWLSIELSLLLLVSMVAFAGFVSWQNNYNNDLTGEAFGSWSKPPPRPSCPKVNCPPPAPRSVELLIVSAAKKTVVVNVNGVRSPELKEGDARNVGGSRVEVLVIGANNKVVLKIDQIKLPDLSEGSIVSLPSVEAKIVNSAGKIALIVNGIPYPLMKEGDKV